MKNETKHTPGGWIESIWGATPVFTGFHQGCYIQKSNDEMVAFVTARDEDVGKANARLIAAAPELLEELELSSFRLGQILEVVTASNPEGRKIADQIIRNNAAIAKAVGKV